MADNPLTLEKMLRGSQNLDVWDAATNGDEDTDWTNLVGDNGPSLKKAIKLIMQKAPINSTPFATKADLLVDTTLSVGSFALVYSDDTLNQNGIYQKTASGCEFVDYNLSNFVDDRVGNPNQSTIIQPLVVDDVGNVAVWLDDGSLDYADSKTVGKKDGVSVIEPLVVDDVGNVAVWLDNGKLGATALSDDLLDDIKNTVTAKDVKPIISDGHTLNRVKAKAGQVNAGASQLRVLITGDSWTEHSTISNQLLKMLRIKYGESGTGWINLAPENNQLDGVSVSLSGQWELQDLNQVGQLDYGSAADGFAQISWTAGSTITVSNITKADTLTIFYAKKGNGTFSYSVNGGQQNTVVINQSGADLQSTTINVSGATELKITHVSGDVAVFGVHARKNNVGVELTKIGNGGSTGKDYLKIAPITQAAMTSYLKPDVVIIILGTNDYRIAGNTVDAYKQGISAIIDGYRTNNTDCGVILIAPAKTNGTTVTPLSDYRDAAIELAQTKNCEFYNMYDDWDSWSVENARSQWADDLHVSNAGANRLASTIFKNFLEY